MSISDQSRPTPGRLCHFVMPGPGRRPPGAFTLLEVVVVIAIIAIVTGLTLGVGRVAGENGRRSRTKVELAALSAVLDAYKRTYGDYPRTSDPARLLQSLIGKRGPDYQAVTGGTLIELAKFQTGGAVDPFVTESGGLLDPWRRTYRYAYKSQSPWSNPSYVLYSTGPDGVATETLLIGGFPDPSGAGNTDNVYANRP